jgi:hypothetical protein
LPALLAVVVVAALPDPQASNMPPPRASAPAAAVYFIRFRRLRVDMGSADSLPGGGVCSVI